MSNKDLFYSPGACILESISFSGMSQAELAERMGRSIPKINELIKGKVVLTEDTALKLENVLDISAQYLLRIERRYRDDLLSIRKSEMAKQHIRWSSNFPIKKLMKWNCIPTETDKAKIAENLLKFFGVASPTQWENIYYGKSVAFKIELRNESHVEAISTWLRLGEKQVAEEQFPDYNSKRLRESFEQLRDISFRSSENWFGEIQSVLKNCGVALIFTPKIPKAPIRGSVRWIKNGKLPLIQITDRHGYVNNFWYAFYHELGHILLHGKKYISIEGLKTVYQVSKLEEEADKFSLNNLIPFNVQKELDNYFTITKELVLEISNKYKIHPGIIVGNLQYKCPQLFKSRELNSLKQKLSFPQTPSFSSVR